MKEESKVRKHFRNNRKFYIGAGVGVIVGAIGTAVFITKKYGMTEDEMENHVMSQLVLTIKGRYNNPNITQQTISIYGNKIGRPGNWVYDTTDNKLYKAQYLGAEAVGATSDMMSKHLQGKLPNLNGHVFVRADSE